MKRKMCMIKNILFILLSVLFLDCSKNNNESKVDIKHEIKPHALYVNLLSAKYGIKESAANNIIEEFMLQCVPDYINEHSFWKAVYDSSETIESIDDSCENKCYDKVENVLLGISKKHGIRVDTTATIILEYLSLDHKWILKEDRILSNENE